MKQEELAERSELHLDTSKGLERNTLEPSLRTLRKLAKGLGGLSLSLLFHGYEQGEHRDARQ